MVGIVITIISTDGFRPNQPRRTLSMVFVRRPCTQKRNRFATGRAICKSVRLLRHQSGQRRGIFEQLADMALQIQPDDELLHTFVFNLSYSATQSNKNSHHNDWWTTSSLPSKNPIVVCRRYCYDRAQKSKIIPFPTNLCKEVFYLGCST